MRRIAIASLLTVACGDDGGTGAETSGTTGPTTSGPSLTVTTGSTAAGSTSSASTTSADGSSSSGGADSSSTGGGGYCAGLAQNIYCEGNTAIECDAVGNQVSETDCAGDQCLEGSGCVVCLADQGDCQCGGVYVCNTDVDPPQWQLVEECDSANDMVCDLALQTCVAALPIGDATPTATAYVYASFASADGVFLGGAGAAGFGDMIYVSRPGAGIDVYQVELLDSDEDGELEPNQHPDNPGAPGAIEERVLTFVEAINYDSGPINELQVYDERLLHGAFTFEGITEYTFASGATNVVAPTPGWATPMLLGVDDSTGFLYSADIGIQQIMEYCPEADRWGIAFEYTPLTAFEVRGVEVVVQPDTSTAFVYVFDLASQLMGQFRKDEELGWTKENVFAIGEFGMQVSGLGFGPLNHFWVANGSELFEIGGGDMVEYTEPSE